MKKLIGFKSFYCCYVVYFLITFFAFFAFSHTSSLELVDVFFTPLFALLYFPVLFLLRASKKIIKPFYFYIGGLLSVISFGFLFFHVFIDYMNFGSSFDPEKMLSLLLYLAISIIVIKQLISYGLGKEEFVVPSKFDFFPLKKYIKISKIILFINVIIPAIITILLMMSDFLEGTNVLFLWTALGLVAVFGLEKKQKWAYLFAYISIFFQIVSLISSTTISYYYDYLYILTYLSVILSSIWVSMSMLYIFRPKSVDENREQ